MVAILLKDGQTVFHDVTMEVNYSRADGLDCADRAGTAGTVCRDADLSLSRYFS